MTNYAAEIRNIVTGILSPIADVGIEDQKTSSTVSVTFRETGQTIKHTFVHGLGYSATARQWAQSILISHQPQPLI